MAAIFWLALAGPVWAVVGALTLPRRYRAKALDATPARLVGGLAGAAGGVFALTYFVRRTPRLEGAKQIPAIAGAALCLELLLLFWKAYPTNVCLTQGSYDLNQLQNGLASGVVYASMAVGLTIVFSVLNIVNFAHGQFFLLGGVLAYLFTDQIWSVNPIVILPLVGLIMFAVGAISERFLLAPMHRGAVERPEEYALLITFGLALFIEYAIVASLGASVGIKPPRYTERPLLGLNNPVVMLGSLRIDVDAWIAGAIGAISMIGLIFFLQKTWRGRSLRAVSMDKAAAAAVGINADAAFTLAFAIGTMLAGITGAALAPVINFAVPQAAGDAGIRSYVIVVLGGLGSVRGALLGGIFVGLVEAAGAGCFPDPNRGSTYQIASGLLIFAVVLLVRPRGFFGRAE